MRNKPSIDRDVNRTRMPDRDFFSRDPHAGRSRKARNWELGGNSPRVPVGVYTYIHES